MVSRCLAIVVIVTALSPLHANEPFQLKDGDRVILLGNALIEHERFHGYLEVTLRRHFPGAKVAFRNLGWSGDTVRGDARTSGYQNPEGMPRLLKETKGQKPSVLILGYGMIESFAGDAGLPAFVKNYEKLLDDLAPLKARIVLLSPTWHEPLPAPLPDPATHNRDLEKYVQAIRELAGRRNCDFVDLYQPLARAKKEAPGQALTSNGILLNDLGYWHVAQAVQHQLGLTGNEVVLQAGPDRKVGAVRLANCPRPGDVAAKDVTLVLRGLPGKNVLTLAGKRLGVVDGMTPLTVPAGPFVDDVENLRKAIVERNDLFYRGWRPYNDHSRHWGFMAKDFQLFDELTTRQDEAIDALRLGSTQSLIVTGQEKKR